jgi:endonuclease/exonuclease/phosphatase family metal-dependent hydrolase
VDIWGLQEVMFENKQPLHSFHKIIPKIYTYQVAEPVAFVEGKTFEGHVILSKYPIELAGVIALQSSTIKNRAALYAIIKINDQKILIVDTDHNVDFFEVGFRERTLNLESLLKGVHALNFAGPTIILGDFNTADSFLNWSRGLSGADEVALTQRFFREQGYQTSESGEPSSYTISKFGVEQQLDHLFFKNIESSLPWYRGNERKGSDHFPIYMDFNLK